MNALVVILAIVAIILLITGGVAHTLNFLLYIGGIILVIAIVVFLLRFIRRNV